MVLASSNSNFSQSTIASTNPRITHHPGQQPHLIGADLASLERSANSRQTFQSPRGLHPPMSLSARESADVADHGLGRPVTIHGVAAGAVHFGHQTDPHSIDAPPEPFTPLQHLHHITLSDTAQIEVVK